MTQADAPGPLPPAFRLATARLELAPFEPHDLPELRALFHDPEVRRYLWDDEIIPDATLAEVIEASVATFRTDGFGHWALRLRGAQEVVGFCGLRRLEDGSELEILYALHPRHWGAGLAREACGAVLDHAFGALDRERIAGRVDTPNRASVRVLEALAMSFEAERPVNGRPTLHFVLGRAAWQARRGVARGPTSR